MIQTKQILLITENLGSGGAERQLTLLAALLKNRGYNVKVLTYGDVLFYLPYLQENNVEHIFMKQARNKWLRTFCFVKVFYKYKPIAIFERYAFVKVCNSDNVKRMYAKHFLQYANQLITIYNIVHLPQIFSDYSIRKNGKLHFILPASYCEVKNPLGLLNTLKLMSKDELELFDITWYGETYKGTLPYYIKLNKEIEKQNLQDVFILKDATTDIANRMNEADVVALFSSSERLPNAICEGMMLGKSIVMTRVSDYSALVNESNGFLCDWSNAQSIRKALKLMIDRDNDQLLDMGKKSYGIAQRLFLEKENI